MYYIVCILFYRIGKSLALQVSSLIKAKESRKTISSR